MFMMSEETLEFSQVYTLKRKEKRNKITWLRLRCSELFNFWAFSHLFSVYQGQYYKQTYKLSELENYWLIWSIIDIFGQKFLKHQLRMPDRQELFSGLTTSRIHFKAQIIFKCNWNLKHMTGLQWSVSVN